MHINTHTLIFELKGSNSSLKPYLLYAHQDVVPCPKETLEEWEVDPFSGAIREFEMNGEKQQCIFGRGAIDDKGCVVAILEALEDLLVGKWKPRRTLFVCFGHDEEAQGTEGALHAARWLADERNIGPQGLEFMLDEGLFIISAGGKQPLIPGHHRPVAMVCVAEKGYVTVKASTHTVPGHASVPPKHTAIGVLGKAAVNIEDTPMPLHFRRGDPAWLMFESLVVVSSQ